MATSSLPTYQRFVNGVPVPTFTRRSFRSKEKYLVLLVFLTFTFVCFGAIFFLPEFTGSSTTTVYKQVYENLQRAGPELLLPIPPHSDDSGEVPGGVKPVRHNMNVDDPHRMEDKAKLQAKIQLDLELKQRVLERPSIKTTTNSPSSSAKSKLDELVNYVIPPPNAVDAKDPNQASKEWDNSISESQAIILPPDGNAIHIPLTQGGEDADSTVAEKRNSIRKMMKFAWDNYVRYAWGKNELRPITKRGHSASIFGTASLGASIVDGLDTLYIMGLTEEFKQGRDWIASNLDLTKVSSDMSVFETNIRFVGGLLACFALTGDTMFREKAEQIAQLLLPAFQTPTGIPNAIVNTKSGLSKNYAWASGGSSILSEFGTLHLEFVYLSDVTGNPIYRNKVSRIRDILSRMEKPRGLYPNYFNPKSGRWGQNHMSMGALGDSFFEYLLKAWLQSGKEDTQAREMYDDAMSAVTKYLLQKSKGGLMYLSDMKFDRLEHKMDHLACFSGGLYGLGAQTMENNVSERYMEIAQGLTQTCHESYAQTATKLGPESFRFTDVLEAKALKSNEKYYILRPEVLESYFILWRLTKDPKYREWGWEVAQALEKHCRVEAGYTGIKNVYLADSQKDDVQQSFFLAETLKYLYLLFSDDDLMNLDEWVFNTEAHPLPIKGVNPLYRMKS